ncbi:MAG: SMC-Scp complex subunit ScpB [Syntrophomonadaceae bacterium]|nr:SMC-Scp complex subunit ScpB [Syntrophomonadaceae bacterium]
MLMREEVMGAVEAILFVRAEQVGIDELVEILDIPLLELRVLMREMLSDYNQNKNRGVQILEVDGFYLMCTNPAYSDILTRMEKPGRKRLSPAALDTLAIIAYRQPVTRAEIEQVRGVKADRIINNLLEKGLILELGFKPVVGKPVTYGTSEEFLRVFGLTSLKELPAIMEET